MIAASGLGQRLALALDAGLDALGDTLVLQPAAEADLGALDAPRIVHPFRPAFDAFKAMGFAVSTEAEAPADTVIVCLPRSRTEAQAMIADAARLARKWVVVDGQKTDGADSLRKAVAARVPLEGTISKAHGKLFWFAAGDAFEDWAQGPALTDGGFWTAPGVFSADGIDEGSALLVDALPDLRGHIADLGAGWGFVAAHVLAHPGVETVHLVEAHHMALQCAQHNVTDPRAQFHWADARTWSPPRLLDAVVMNPPFHTGRSGTPGLGQAFISAAAGMLNSKGRLFMVANRHLPYEDTLDQMFRKTIDLGGNQRFKLFMSEAPRKR